MEINILKLGTCFNQKGYNGPGGLTIQITTVTWLKIIKASSGLSMANQSREKPPV